MKIRRAPLLPVTGRPLDGQGVDRQAVGRKSLDLPERILHITDRLSGQSGDQVHIDIVKSQLPGQFKRRHGLLHRMPPPHQVQRLLLHGLWIHGNAAHREFLQHLQLLFRNAVRPPRLHGKFQKT